MLYYKSYIFFLVARNTADASYGVGQPLHEDMRVVAGKIVEKDRDGFGLFQPEVTFCVKGTAVLSRKVAVVTYLSLLWIHFHKLFSVGVARVLTLVTFPCGLVKDHWSLLLKGFVNLTHDLFELLNEHPVDLVVLALADVRDRVHGKTLDARNHVKAKGRRNVSLV